MPTTDPGDEYDDNDGDEEESQSSSTSGRNLGMQSSATNYAGRLGTVGQTR